MRILLMGDIRPVHLKRWRDYFRSRGHDVATLSLEEDPSDHDYVHLRSGMPVRALRYFLKRGVVERIIDRFKPDVVNAHFVPSYGLLAVAAGFHPTVVSLWGSDILVSPRKSRFHRARALWVLRNCDLITSDSAYMTVEAAALGRFDAEMVTEPMGVPRSFLDRLERRSSAGGSGRLVILSTRRLEPVYGVDILVSALCKVRDRLPPFRCMICGDGSQKTRLESAVERSGLAEVEFLSWKSGDDYIEMIGQADIYVSCSKADSTSVSLLEAMAAGAMPIVTDLPGNREWVNDGESALMFPVGDADALASSLLRAAGDRVLRQAAASINRMTVESRAVWEENMGRIEKAFENVVSRKKQ